MMGIEQYINEVSATDGLNWLMTKLVEVGRLEEGRVNKCREFILSNEKHVHYLKALSMCPIGDLIWMIEDSEEVNLGNYDSSSQELILKLGELGIIRQALPRGLVTHTNGDLSRLGIAVSEYSLVSGIAMDMLTEELTGGFKRATLREDICILNSVASDDIGRLTLAIALVRPTDVTCFNNELLDLLLNKLSDMVLESIFLDVGVDAS